MDDAHSIKLSIQPEWDRIGGVREKTADLLKNRDKDLIDDAVMAVTELMENAIKYGMANAAVADIDFRLADQGDRIVIKVSNKVKQKGDIYNLIAKIDKIKSSQDLAGLYAERMKELMDNSNPGKTQLGLYRIAYEGNFKLDCEYQDGVITITAERSLQKGGAEMLNGFKNGGLEIQVVVKDNDVNIVWKGRSEDRQPSALLNPYFTGLLDELVGKEVNVDFTLLEYMNSSTVVPIINLIKNLEGKSIKSSIIYDKNQKWQAASFKALEVMANMMNKVKVSGK
jgi:anti-sigma regulatory factor (Ser/Thr protein kinase)